MDEMIYGIYQCQDFSFRLLSEANKVADFVPELINYITGAPGFSDKHLNQLD